MEATFKIYESLANIMNDIEAVGKGKTNAQQGYKFRGIDDMYNALHPFFAKHNVFITSEVLESKREERTAKSGSLNIYTILKVRFNFIGKDGGFISSTLEGEAMDNGDKSTNKALSTALKYALMQMFLIPTEEVKDNDANGEALTAKKEEKKPEAPKTPAAPSKKIALLVDTPNFNKCVDYLQKSGGDGMKDILGKYNMTEEVKQALMTKAQKQQ